MLSLAQPKLTSILRMVRLAKWVWCWRCSEFVGITDVREIPGESTDHNFFSKPLQQQMTVALETHTLCRNSVRKRSACTAMHMGSQPFARKYTLICTQQSLPTINSRAVRSHVTTAYSVLAVPICRSYTLTTLFDTHLCNAVLCLPLSHNSRHSTNSAHSPSLNLSHHALLQKSKAPSERFAVPNANNMCYEPSKTSSTTPCTYHDRKLGSQRQLQTPHTQATLYLAAPCFCRLVLLPPNMSCTPTSCTCGAE